MKKILWSFLVAVIALCNIGYAESTNGIVLPQIVTETVDSGGRLLFSDSPEYVKKNGVLYADTVQGEARVLYYHLNDSDMSRKFGVVVENITGKPVTVTVKQWGDGTPIADDYLVLGKETQTAYFSHHTPYHLKLEPGEKRLLAASMDERVVGAQELVYGVYDFFADGEVKVTVLAYPVTADPCRFLRIARIQPADELHGGVNIDIGDRALDAEADTGQGNRDQRGAQISLVLAEPAPGWGGDDAREAAEGENQPGDEDDVRQIPCK